MRRYDVLLTNAMCIRCNRTVDVVSDSGGQPVLSWHLKRGARGFCDGSLTEVTVTAT